MTGVDRGHRRTWMGLLGAIWLCGYAGIAGAQGVADPAPPTEQSTTHPEIPVVAPVDQVGTPPAVPPEIVAPEPAPQQLQPQPQIESPQRERQRDISGIDLSTLETPNMALLYFDPPQTYLTPYIARAFQNAFEFHREHFKWTPWDRTTVLLKDFGDYGNAAARASPNNAILLDVAPLSQTMETFSPGERFFTLTNHELAHVATMDVWNEHDAGWRRFLHGKPMPIQEHPESIVYNYLSTPRVNVPRWYLEGSAVFFETWMAGGLGRGQGAFDEMVFRAKVRDNAPLYSPLGLESYGTAVDFQVGVNDYLYGTRFFSYLALTYGPERMTEWLRRGEGSQGYYATQFKHVFGKSLDQSWAEWIASERVFQRQNLDALSKYPLTPLEHLTEHGLGSVSRTFYDAKTNSIVGAFRYPGVIGFVGTLSLETGKLRHLHDIKGAMLYRVTSLAFDPDARKIYYTEDNYAFRDVVELDVDTGKKRTLLKDSRIGDLVVNPVDKSIWGLRHQNGFATLVRIPQPLAGFNQVYTFDYGQTPFDLDISPDGSQLSASFGEVNGDQSVRVWQIAGLMAGSGLNEVARLNMPPATPEGFVFTPNGKALYGSSYYTGASNIYRFDIEKQGFDAVSNASTGLFRPLPMADGSLIVYDYTGEGLTPSRMQPEVVEDLGTIKFLGNEVAEQRPEVKTWGVGSPAKVDLDSLVTERGHYVPTKEMSLDAAYPIVEGYKGTPALGYYLHFEDPMQFRQLTATVSVSPFDRGASALERLHADLEYKSLNWSVRYWHNDADVYDLAGPVERSRKGDAFIFHYQKAKIYDPPRQLDIFATAAAYFGLERLPGAQNITSPSTILSSEIGANYTNQTRSLGAIDHEKGVAARLAGSLDYAQSLAFPKLYGGFDYGVPLPVRNSSVWIYTHAGIAGGDGDRSLGSFYFGAFRNNYVDDRIVKRYREMEAFPGFDIDQIDARRFAKATIELNLPPLRFQEIGTPSFFLSSARTAVFAGILATDRADAPSRTYQDIGGQVDFNFTVALRLPMTFSVGAASGFESGHYRKTEILFSLKIL